MAKTSFIMYASQWEVLKDFTDTELGQVMRQVFEYSCEGKEPNKPSIAFKFIKVQLELDTEKYEAICERNKSNGAKGGRPKKTQENPNNPLGFLETQEYPKEPKKPDNDNDNDNDNENENDLIYIDSSTAPSSLKKNIPVQELLKSRTWCEAICMKHHITMQALEQKLTEFDISNQCRGITMHKDMAEMQRHFDSWLNITMEAERKANITYNNNKPKTKQERLKEQALELQRLNAEIRAYENEQR